MRYDHELGHVVFHVEHPHREGPIVAVDVLDFLARLSLHVPDERERLAVYYGVYSSASKHAADDAPSQAYEAFPTVATPDPYALSTARRLWRKKWAELIRRVFLADPLTCSRCGQQMRISSFVTMQTTIDKILRHIGWKHVDPPPPRYYAPEVPNAAALG